MYEQKNTLQVTKELNSDPHTGLSEHSVHERQQQYGKNALAEERAKTKAEMLLEQLNDPLIFVLFVAAAISMLLHEISDTIIIVTVILLNAVVGIVQEGKAIKALDALKKLTSPSALVKRDGRVTEVSASGLVPGDIVLLEAGRQVPADLRLLTSASLKIEEASLTGESHPIEKDARFTASGEVPLGDRINMAYMSTNVIYGRGEGIVTATGMQTEIGRIAGLIQAAPNESTPLQKRLADLGKLLSIIAILLCVALFAIALLQDRNLPEMLITAISLAVAAVPEGLPAVVTIVLALSVTRMVKVNTIIRRLPSVETLGAVSIVCSDKTGTLTQNKMTVTKCYTNQGFHTVHDIKARDYKHFLEGFLLCNDASINDDIRIGDPTELAFLDMGKTCQVSKHLVDHKYPRTKEIPFDSSRKMMTTLHRTGSGTVSYTKGAGDVILERCTHVLIDQKAVPITGRHKTEIRNAIESMSGEALRVLALGMRQNITSPSEEQLTFVGLAGMIDPVRPEVFEAVGWFNNAQVKTVMITGDHVDTAFAIAKEIGIAEQRSQCMDGATLNTLSDQALAASIKDITVFARVSSEHKVRIVKAFKAQNNIVAMTGDGVNDAPSLKTADIGIAMGINGTDVAKNASDIILTDDNFATIEKAIAEGRGVYENIKKSVIFLLSSNIGEIITMFISILVGLVSPLKASHILWINLITDSLPALALGVDKNDTKYLMSKPPRHAKESLFAGGGWFLTFFYGALIAGISLTAFLTLPYLILQSHQMPLTIANISNILSSPAITARAQTYAFTVLGLSQLFHAVGMRSVEQSVFGSKLFSNPLMLIAIAVGFLLQIAVTEVPYLIHAFGTVSLSLQEWLMLTGLAAVPLLAHECLALGKTKPKKAVAAEEKIAGQTNTDSYQV